MPHQTNIITIITFLPIMWLVWLFFNFRDDVWLWWQFWSMAYTYIHIQSVQNLLNYFLDLKQPDFIWTCFFLKSNGYVRKVKKKQKTQTSPYNNGNVRLFHFGSSFLEQLNELNNLQHITSFCCPKRIKPGIPSTSTSISKFLCNKQKKPEHLMK